VAYDNVCAPEDGASCGGCQAGGLEGPSRDCMGWFMDVVATGVCGYPAEMPDTSSVRTCFASWRPAVYAFVGVYVLQVGVLIAGALHVLRKDDQVIARVQVLANVAVVVPLVLLVAVSELFSREPLAWAALPSGFSTLHALVLFISAWSLLSTILLPAALSVSREAGPPRTSSCHDLRVATARGPTTSSGARSSRRPSRMSSLQIRANERASVSDMLLGWLDEGETNQGELLFALHYEPAGRLYKKHTMREFTVENFQFLEKVRDLVLNESESSLSELATQARFLFNTYVASDSPLQLNIAAASRRRVARRLRGMESRRGLSVLDLAAVRRGAAAAGRPPRHPAGSKTTSSAEDLKDMVGDYPFQPSSPTTGRPTDKLKVSLAAIEQAQLAPLSSANELLDWFAPAISDVKRLLLRDSWTRFQRSADLYGPFRAMYDAEASVGGGLSQLLRVGARSRPPSRHPSVRDSFRTSTVRSSLQRTASAANALEARERRNSNTPRGGWWGHDGRARSETAPSQSVTTSARSQSVWGGGGQSGTASARSQSARGAGGGGGSSGRRVQSASARSMSVV